MPGHPSIDGRAIRGGDWFGYADKLAFGARDGNGPDISLGAVGFRVAAVPEPEQYAAVFGVALLGTGVWLRRKKV